MSSIVLEEVGFVDERLEEIKQEVERGFRNEKTLEPVRCTQCMGEDFEERNLFYEEYYVVEYEKWCTHCGNIAGRWSYGQWET